MHFNSFLSSLGVGAQTTLAKNLGVAKYTVSRWVHGDNMPRTKTRQKIEAMAGRKITYGKFKLTPSDVIACEFESLIKKRLNTQSDENLALCGVLAKELAQKAIDVIN